MSYKFQQGEDIVITIPLIDDNNNKLSLSGATSIRASLIIKDTIVKKYMDVSLETLISGYGNCNSGATIYDLDIILTRDETDGFPIGDMTTSVLIKFADGFKTNTYYEYNYDVGTVTKGFLRNETFV